MNPDTASAAERSWYEIRVQGRLDRRWAASLDGMSLSPGNDGTTLIAGLVADQSALHGLLSRLRDLGLPLVSVNRADPAGHTHHHSTPRSEMP